MGMFDSLYDAEGREWQTKALACLLTRYEIGDEIEGPPIDHQMQVLGDGESNWCWGYATIRGGRLVEINRGRDITLSLREYSSGWLRAHERGNAHTEGN